MIDEIVQFVQYLQKNQEKDSGFLENSALKEGLYILLDIKKENDEYILVNQKEIFETKEDTFLKTKNNECDDFKLQKIFEARVQDSMVVGTGKNKSFNSSLGIFMFTATPFGIALRKGSPKDKKGFHSPKIEEGLNDYFGCSNKYLNRSNPQYILWAEAFESFCKSNLITLITKLKDYEKLKKDDPIYFFLKEPCKEDFKAACPDYYSEKVFSTKDSKILVSDNQFYGPSILCNSNQKKPFLKHYTAPFEFIHAIETKRAASVYEFIEMAKEDKFPNPLPIFIDEQELNKKVVSIVNKKSEKYSYREIIKQLIEDRKEDLQKYYLIFLGKGKEAGKLIDIDFVPCFEYKLDNCKIENLFLQTKDKSTSPEPINDVFDLEEVFNEILNNQLIINTKNGLWFRYFGDIQDNLNYLANHNLLLKYRKTIYDYIYKSAKSAFSSLAFDDILRIGILEDIRLDEYDASKKQNSNGYRIKHKLDIWFSLYNYFDGRTEEINMVSKIKDLREKLKTIIENEGKNIHIENDSEFAFITGQVIYYVLSKSETSDKSYSRLETFLQKTSCTEFKKALANTFAAYKHKEFTEKFRYAMSEVMLYDTNTNIKELLPEILGGFFSECLLFSVNKQKGDLN